MQIVQRLARSLRRDGLWGTVKHAAELTFIPMRNGLRARLVYLQDKAFDIRYGVNTKVGIYGIKSSELDLSGPNAGLSTNYSPTRRAIFFDMLRSISITYDRFDFIDLGSGMGKAILLASMFPFRRVIGVELSEQLCDGARENLRRFRGKRACQRVEIENLDATAFSFEAVPTVLYLFNPFHEPVMRAVLANVVESLRAAPREFIVFYYHPRVGHLLAEHPSFEKVREASEFTIFRFVS